MSLPLPGSSSLKRASNFANGQPSRTRRQASREKSNVVMRGEAMSESPKPAMDTPPQISMNVPPFTDQLGSDADKALASEVLRLTREARVLLGQFFLYTAMSRSREFADACNASDAREGAAIAVGSLLRSMVVSTAALFDEDRRTSNIPKVLRAALSPERSAFLQKFHAHHEVEHEAQISSQRLVKYGRSIRRGKLRDAISALSGVRNTFVAHFDLR